MSVGRSHPREPVYRDVASQEERTAGGRESASANLAVPTNLLPKWFIGNQQTDLVESQ